MYLEMTGLYYWGYAFVALAVWIVSMSEDKGKLTPVQNILSSLFIASTWPLWILVKLIQKVM